jgi:hypothetical protein
MFKYFKGGNKLNLKEIIEEAIKIYNHFRSPEAIAKLIEVSLNQFTVEFKGPFCRSCGVYDYFEDLIYEIKSLVSSLNIEVAEVKENDEGFIVIYKILS